MNTDHPPLDLNFIQEQLASSRIGHTLDYHTSIPSTMTVAAELARNPDIPSGIVVVAEEQSSGRGRHGRTWHAPYAAALLVSIVLKQPHLHFPAPTLTMIAGNALLAAAAMVAPDIAGELKLKWPNDLVVGADPGSARKVAGILAESAFAPDHSLIHAILGIGINVNQQAGELPRIAPPTPRPTSLRVATHQARHKHHSELSNQDTSLAPLIDRSYLLVHLCQELAQSLTRSPAESYQQWKSNLATLGQTITVYAQGVEHAPTLTGLAVDVQADGALVVEDASGDLHRFHAADVSIRPH